jgi:hypothetical protein
VPTVIIAPNFDKQALKSGIVLIFSAIACRFYSFASAQIVLDNG